jgi:hypothetical protein
VLFDWGGSSTGSATMNSFTSGHADGRRKRMFREASERALPPRLPTPLLLLRRPLFCGAEIGPVLVSGSRARGCSPSAAPKHRGASGSSNARDCSYFDAGGGVRVAAAQSTLFPHGSKAEGYTTRVPEVGRPGACCPGNERSGRRPRMAPGGRRGKGGSRSGRGPKPSTGSHRGAPRSSRTGPQNKRRGCALLVFSELRTNVCAVGRRVGTRPRAGPLVSFCCARSVLRPVRRT